jgi:hypothetical protein
MTLTIPEMKDRCIEAAETFRKMRIKVGPGSKSGFWPEFQFDRTKDYAPDQTRVIVLPTALEIQRAEEFTGWVNRYLAEEDRKAIRQWAALKTHPNRTIRGFCRKIGLQEHHYRRKIDKIFERLAFNVYGKAAVSCSMGVDDTAESGENRAGSGRNADGSRSFGTHGTQFIRDAKPQHLPESRDHRRLIKQLLQKQRQRTAA